MKIISLNCWSGARGNLFFDFVKEHAATTDIFCFQEAYTAWPGAPEIKESEHMFLLQELTAFLPDFIPFFAAKSHGSYESGLVDWPVNRGQILFIRSTFAILGYAAYEIGSTEQLERAVLSEGKVIAQVISLSRNGSLLNLVHMHGMSRPGTKNDTPERLLQSQRLMEIVEQLPKGPIVLCGDFNLMPDTQSIALIEARLRNLITEFGITNTRNEISWGKHPPPQQHFADYTFISSGVHVISFEVPYNTISDHLPMILECEV